MEITPCSEREEALVNTLLLVSEVILKLWLILKAKGNYRQCCKKIRGVKCGCKIVFQSFVLASQLSYSSFQF